MERHAPLPRTCAQPGRAVHDIRGHEEECGERGEEGEQDAGSLSRPTRTPPDDPMFLFFINIPNKLGVLSSTSRLLAFFCVVASTNLCVLFQISIAEIFVIGAVAKAIATTATYPLQTIQAILRVNIIAFVFFSFSVTHLSPSVNVTRLFLFGQFGQYKGDGNSGIIGSISNIFALFMDRIK